MNQERERRRYSRYEASLEIVIRELSPPGTPDPLPVSIHSETRDISNGGLCVLLDQECHVSSVLKCGIFIAGSAVAIPTLAHVRWMQRNERGKFATGLAFLL
jgi:hypothetical protein